jgi:ABC-type uncharacterized transport system involved in gliding motility auxiliary subunit
VAYFGLAGTNSTDERETIPFIALERQDFMELDLSRLIFKLANPGKKKIAVLSRLPITGNVNPQTGQSVPPWLIFDQLGDYFDIDVLSPTFSGIADDVDLLLLAAPGQLDDKTAYAIDQFALSGKPVIVFADPYSEVLPRDRGNLEKNENFTRLLASWGVKVTPDSVVGDIDNSRQVQFYNQGQPAIVNYVTWLALPETSFDRSDGIFQEVASITMASAGALEEIDGSGMAFQPLIASSPRSAMIDTDDLRNPNPIALLQTYLPEGGQRVLAARVRGEAKTVYANGKPEDSEASGEHIAVGPVNVLAVSDADMLYDTFWAEVAETNGRRSIVPRAGNANLLINAVQDMAGGQALSGLRGRGVEQRPFTLVNQLRADANARFRQREQLLNQKLQDTQKKLAELLQRSEDGEVTLTEADRRAIEEFRSEMFATRRSLRDVQRNLRADIVSLGTRLKVINIGIVPLLIGLIGLFFLWRRRTRASSAKLAGEGRQS